jgi:spore coat protein U-like protein
MVATKGNEIMKSAKLFLGLAVLGVLSIGSVAVAQPASRPADLAVSATIAKNCTIATVAVGFPAYDPIVTHATAADDSTSGSITVACTKGAAITIALGQGGNYSGGNRMVHGTADFLSYTLFKDAGRGDAWGTGTAAMSVTAANRNAVTYPVYGRIAGGQDQPEGEYTDTVVATVNF